MIAIYINENKEKHVELMLNFHAKMIHCVVNQV
jgi:hypothetical protein